MALDPLFTVNFDVTSSDNYGQFISNLRYRLGNPGHFTHNRPVLPPVEPDVPPSRWFHIVLRTPEGNQLTVTTRADNLYLEGFQSSDGTWWELTRGIIPGATYMGFGGSYRDLLGDTDRLTNEIIIGPQKMMEAVKVLAKRVPASLADGDAQQDARNMLPVLLLMLHEATRFATVSGFVAELMHPRSAMKSGRITAEMKAQVNGWADLSAALLRADQKPPGQFTPIESMGVNTVEKAAATVGILLFVEVPGGLTVQAALEQFEMKAQVNGRADLSAALLRADVKPPGQFTPIESMGVNTVEEAAATVGILLFVEVPGGLTAEAALELFGEE